MNPAKLQTKSGRSPSLQKIKNFGKEFLINLKKKLQKMKYLLFTFFLLSLGSLISAVSTNGASDFEPTIPGWKRDVLVEIFSSVFQPCAASTSSTTPHNIRGHIQKHLGYISRTGVDYILAIIGCMPDVDTDLMEELMLMSHTPDQHSCNCKVPRNVWRAMERAQTTAAWINSIETKTGAELPLSKAALASGLI